MGGESNRRKHQRVGVVLKVSYNSPVDFLADYAQNVSRGGLFISTKEPFTIGERIEFEISFPGLLSPIACTGEVRWRRKPEESSDQEPPGIGLAFVFPEDQKPAALIELTDRLAARSEAATQPAAPGGQVAHQPSSTFRVLLVEDNVSIRKMFQYAVKKFHKNELGSQLALDVVEEGNGHAAWERIRQESFHLVIVDHYLPVMDGVHLIKNIRQDPDLRHLPVIMASVGGDEIRRDAYEAGVDLYLDKPLLMNELLHSMALLVPLSGSDTLH